MTLLRAWIGGTLGCLSTAATFAQDFSYRGFVEYETYQYPTAQPNPTQVTENHAFQLRLEGTYRLSESWRIGFQPFFRVDLNDHDRDNARADELWIEYQSPDWDLRMGNQLFTWGGMESVSPVDVINPRDYYEDIIDPEKIGVPAVRFRWLGDNQDLSAYYLPYFEPSMFPEQHSFYSVGGGLPSDVPDPRFANQWALRYFYGGEGFDLALSYFHGFEPTPLFDLSPEGDAVVGTVFRSDRFGIEITKVVGDLLLKGEAVYRDTKTPLIASSFLFATGVEYTFSEVWQHSDLTFFLEYLGNSSTAGTGTFQVLQNDLFAGFRWNINDSDNQVLEGGLLQDLSNIQSRLYRVEYRRNLFDHYSFGVQYTNSFGFFADSDTDEDQDGAVNLYLRFNF